MTDALNDALAAKREQDEERVAACHRTAQENAEHAAQAAASARKLARAASFPETTLAPLVSRAATRAEDWAAVALVATWDAPEDDEPAASAEEAAACELAKEAAGEAGAWLVVARRAAAGRAVGPAPKLAPADDDSGRPDHWKCATCELELEARSAEDAAFQHGLWIVGHPFRDAD